MNLNLTPVQVPHMTNNVSFGMAKFTKEGMRLAQTSADVYEPLATPTEFQDPAFFKNKKFLHKAPFAKYMQGKIPSGKPCAEEDINEVTETIISCGTSNNAFSNAKFIKQLLTTKKHVDNLPDSTQEPLRYAISEVFKTNWNNPELSKAETAALLEMSKGEIQDNQYITLTGVIEKSDTPDKK